jgi:outer membrane protein
MQSAALALVSSLCFAAPAYCDDDPSNSLRAGLYAVFYHSSADDISGPYVPPGVNIDAKDVQTLYVAYVRRLSEHFDAELALGYPPLTKTVGSGPATLGSVPYDGQVISTARWLAPTVLLDYKFGGENSKLRPYIGVGVNYTTFYDRDSTAQGNAASGGPTKLSLSASVGPAGTVGLAYHIVDHWNFYASYSASQVKTKLSADTAGVIRNTNISFGPQALVLALGYSF